MARRTATAVVLLGVSLAGCGGADLAGIGGGQILSFVDDLDRPATFFYCPEQGCARPLVHTVQPGEAWRTASETINGAGAVSVGVAGQRRGCRIVPAVGFMVESLLVIKASAVQESTTVACVRERS